MQRFWQKIAEILLLSRLEKRWQKVARLLAVVVVFCTTYMLILPAITMEKETYCGIEDHIHTDECYISFSAELGPDGETPDVWEATLEGIVFTENGADNVLAVAYSQIGYAESELNYELDENGEVQGYTRYGQWYGNPYGNWNAMFVSFCLYYARLENTDALTSSGVAGMRYQWDEQGLYESADSHTAKVGELIFIDTTADGEADHIGIVSVITDTGLKVIIGDWENAVKEVDLDNISVVLGYGLTDSVAVKEVEEETTVEVTEEAAEEETTTEKVFQEATEEETTEPETSQEETTQKEEEETTVEVTEETAKTEEETTKTGEETAKTEEKDDNEADGNYSVNLMADTLADDYAVDLLAETDAGSRISFDSLDGSGSTYYIVFTYYNGKYYALKGEGLTPVEVNVSDDGVVTSASMAENLYWNFMDQGSSSYIMQNLGTSRYMHNYNNSTGIGVTTSGRYPSTLITTGSGSEKTFCVKSNSDYSMITTSNGSVTFTATYDQSEAAQFYLAEVYIPQDTYYVWFDGTCGGLMSLYESDDECWEVPEENTTITLPTTWKSPSKYYYTLNGWYDIKNHKYYEPGAEVTITKNTVFYADWVAASYDVGIVNEENVNLVASSLDTNSFIRTDMFDYSAIFNIQSVRHTGSVSSTSHSETWTVVQNDTVPYNSMDSLGFTFRDWDSDSVNISYAGNRARLNNNIGSEITTGIIDYVNEMSGQNIIDLLFNPQSQVIGKNYVGQANYLYQFMEEGSANYDDEHNGYYYYDATLNAASYNQTNQRFYIYNYLERTSDSYKDSCDSNGIKTAEGGYSDFLPFNSPYANNHNNKTIVRYADGDDVLDNYQYDAKATNQSSAIENMGTNYWFGMKSEINFYLPDDTGTVDEYQNYGNISSHGKHMTFEFSGDDDMWVFIDGELVMDIGGLHGVMSGKIDFSTGIMTTSLANDVNETGTAATVEKAIPTLKAGDHTLTVYYMERGGSQSNCAIYFNITPRYGVELVKQDAIAGGGLDGAKFGVYTDVACETPALLWTSEQAYQNGEDSNNEFTAVNGKISFWGVSAGKVYYIKELVAPTGYPLTDDIIRVSMNSLGNSVCTADALRGEDGVHTDGFEIINNSADEARQKLSLTLTNQQYTTNKRNVAVTKYWEVSDSDFIPESVTVYLTANGQNTGKTAVLSEANDWTYLWIDLPIYDSIGDKIEYSVYEEQAEDFYTDVEVSEEGEYINAWVQTDAFYDGGTFLIVDRSTATETTKGKALTVNSSGNFEWIDFETAKNEPYAHWVVNADGMGFHVVNREDYHIILNGTDEFVPELDGNRILYYDSFGLAARNSNTYYYLNDNFTASTVNHLELELYINMDILIHEEDEAEEDSEIVDGEDAQEDDQIFVTMYNVTNTYIGEEERTSFNVSKVWEDGATNHINSSIKVRLFADGVDTGRVLTLSHENDWEGIFEGLRYEDDEGNKIEYTVIEEGVNGYYPEYSEITEIEGGTKSETKWVTATALEAGKTYMFTSGNNSLASNSSNAVVSATRNEDDAYQQWKVVSYNGNLKLQNVGNSRYLYYRNSLTTNTGYTNNYTNVTLSSNRLTIGSSTGRYITLSSSVSTTTNTSNATTLTVEELATTEITLQPSYSITVTNRKAHYVLPETGGYGTNYLYIIGGLLIILSSVFLLCLYKKRQRKEGRRLRE